MENSDDLVTDMSALRAAINTKYLAYHKLDKDRFPKFEYNTNRANYEPLRLSFDEEFYVVRGIDRTRNSLHIPSTNTLALIFCDDSYVPGKKILETCRSYAAGKSTIVPNGVEPAIAPAATRSKKLLAVASLVVLLGLAAYWGSRRVQSTSSPGELSIYHPYSSQVLPRQSFAEGRVVNADTVWIVIRAVDGAKYWVQPPIKVDKNHRWRGRIYLGSVDKGDIGIRSEVRAFVNPAQTLAEGDVLDSWPDAELSSDIIEVVRGKLEIID